MTDDQLDIASSAAGHRVERIGENRESRTQKVYGQRVLVSVAKAKDSN